MAATLDEQTHLFPFSGTTQREDGAGAHSWLPFDLHYAINNLGGKVARDVKFVSSPMVDGQQSGEECPGAVETLLAVPSSEERYVCQTKIRLHPTATRMVWHAGVEVFHGPVGSAEAEVTAVTCYLSAQPYRGARDVEFDPALLGDASNVPSRTVAVTLDTTTADGVEYELAADDSVGFVPAVPNAYNDAGTDNPWCYLIVTVTGSYANVGEGEFGLGRICDFAMWPEYE